MTVTGAQVANGAETITNIVGRVASFGTQALPVAEFLAGFFPGMAPVLQAIQIAAPYIAKIAAAAPEVSSAINAARPAIDAAVAAAPEVLPHLKAIYAIAVNHDPARPETKMTAADVPDATARAYGAVVFTRGWTIEEQQRAWDRAQGQS